MFILRCRFRRALGGREGETVSGRNEEPTILCAWCLILFVYKLCSNSHKGTLSFPHVYRMRKAGPACMYAEAQKDYFKCEKSTFSPASSMGGHRGIVVLNPIPCRLCIRCCTTKYSRFSLKQEISTVRWKEDALPSQQLTQSKAASLGRINFTKWSSFAYK